MDHGQFSFDSGMVFLNLGKHSLTSVGPGYVTADSISEANRTDRRLVQRSLFYLRLRNSPRVKYWRLGGAEI